MEDQNQIRQVDFSFGDCLEYIMEGGTFFYLCSDQQGKLTLTDRLSEELQKQHYVAFKAENVEEAIEVVRIALANKGQNASFTFI